MAETPFSNLGSILKDRIIPKLEKNDSNDHAETEEYDVLDRLNIPHVINLSDEVLTPSSNKAVQFNEQRAGGFNVKEVEKYHRRVNLTIKELFDTLELRNQHVTKLASEIDKYQTDLSNKVIQLQAIEAMGGIPMQDNDGNYMKKSDLSDDQRTILSLEETIAEKYNLEQILNAKNTELTRETETLKSKYNELYALYAELQKTNEQLTASNVPVDENHPAIMAYTKWVEEVRVEYDRIAKELKESKHKYTLLQAQYTDNKIENTGLDVASKTIEQLKNSLEQSEADNQSLRTSLESNATQLREMTENYSLAQANHENHERASNSIAELTNKLENETARVNQESQLRNQLEQQLSEIQQNAQSQIKNMQDVNDSLIEEQEQNTNAFNELQQAYQALLKSYEDAAETIKTAGTIQAHYQQAVDANQELQEENNKLRANLANNVTRDVDPTKYTAAGEERGSGNFVLPEGVNADDI